jgi:ABC-2 type transport system ATP-binding protein
MITAEQLTKRFGTFTAIEDVSFEVGRGEIVGFLGPNGAGKSTTMRILAGVFPPTRGRATIAGYDVVRDSLRARSAVGYFPERVSLYLDMTVLHYLTYVGELKGLRRGAAKRAAGEAAESCALRGVAGRLIGSLSKGFRQRVGIAQSLVGSPRILILDEPTAGLDPEQVADMRELIRELKSDRTVILSTHVLSEVEVTCDRVIIIHRGRILAVDTPFNLNRRLRQNAQVYLEVKGPAADVLPLLRSVPGVLAVQADGGANGALALTLTTARDRDVREDLAAAVAGRGWGLLELRPVTLTLEEIFLTVVANDEPAGESADETARDLPA